MDEVYDLLQHTHYVIFQSAYYYLSDPKNENFTETTRNTILGRIVAVEENQVLIKLDLMLIGNPLFDFSDSVTRLKIMNSNAILLTSDDVKDGIREFIKIKFSFDAQESTILNIMKELGNRTFTDMVNKHQEELIRSIRPFDICAEISKHLPNNLEQLLPNTLYLRGTFRYSISTIKNSNIYGKPRILSIEHSAISSSIFLNSKPDAIMNIDIMLDSTVLSFSLLDENGLVKEIWNHDYFVPDIGISLRSLDRSLLFKSNIKCQKIVYRFVKLLEKKGLLKFIALKMPKIAGGASSEITLSLRTSKRYEYMQAIWYKKMAVIKNSELLHKERLLPVIQQSFKLQFPLKSFFVVAQLHKDYVQLTLNQVVTESGSDHEDQETIVIKKK
ncbi:hypothetical protein BDF21DRAFT_405172 [Thamnidium elegans]|nr:hypothetical protein BDF21DRAFT_405172 [Thamnidium elegans]